MSNSCSDLGSVPSAASRQRPRFRDDCRASSIVEFALVLPVLLLMLVGAAEVAQAWTAERKLLRATNVVGDMISREPVQTRQTLNQLFDAAEAIIEPTDASKLRIKFTAIELDAQSGDYLVVWSHARRQPRDRVGSVFEPQDGDELGNNFYIVVTLEAKHTGNFTQLFIDEVTYNEQFEYQPRDSDRIDLVLADPIPVLIASISLLSGSAT